MICIRCPKLIPSDASRTNGNVIPAVHKRSFASLSSHPGSYATHPLSIHILPPSSPFLSRDIGAPNIATESELQQTSRQNYIIRVPTVNLKTQSLKLNISTRTNTKPVNQRLSLTSARALPLLHLTPVAYGPKLGQPSSVPVSSFTSAVQVLFPPRHRPDQNSASTARSLPETQTPTPPFPNPRPTSHDTDADADPNLAPD